MYGQKNIKKVIDNPFSVRPLHDGLTTAENERPAAPLPNLMTVHITKSNTQNIFASLYINRFDWPAGCETAEFVVLPVQFIFLRDTKYGTNRAFCVSC